VTSYDLHLLQRLARCFNCGNRTDPVRGWARKSPEHPVWWICDDCLDHGIVVDWDDKGSPSFSRWLPTASLPLDEGFVATRLAPDNPLRSVAFCVPHDRLHVFNDGNAFCQCGAQSRPA
jgi:hypothetical protein